MQPSLMSMFTFLRIVSNVTSLQCAYSFTSQNHDDISSVSVKYGDNSCLVFVSSGMTFDQAERVCRENNGHLVDLDCNTESYIQGIFDKPTFSPPSAYWIGLRRYDETWKWVNGDTTLHRDIDESSWGFRKSGKCIKMKTSTIEFDPEDCDNKLPFICILKNMTDSVAVHNETESLTTQISPNVNVTTASPKEPDPCVCNTTVTEASDNGTGITNCSNHTLTMEHQALQNTLDDLMTKLVILLTVLGISLLINVIIVIVCLVQQRSKVHCPHSCVRTVQMHKVEELQMSPLLQTPQSEHSIRKVIVHDPTVSCGTSENELYSCVEDQIEVPEKLGSTNELNIYSSPEENENIYEDQFCRRGSEAIMCSNSIYGQGSCQDLYEECDIESDKGRQTFENNRSIESKKTEVLDDCVNQNCEDINKCMSKTSKTTVHPDASTNSYDTFSKLKMKPLDPISSSGENVYGIESGTDLVDANNDTIQPDTPKNEVTDPCCTYSDFNLSEPNTIETAGENAYGMESATYLTDENKLQSGQLQEITDMCDIYSNLKTVQSETVTSDHGNVYENKLQSGQLQEITDMCDIYSNLKTVQSETVASDHENVYGIESATYLPGDSKLQSGPLQEITDMCDIYSNPNTGQSETIANDHENVYVIESASKPHATFDENLQNDLSYKLPSHENVCGIKSATIITNDEITYSSQNLQTGTFNSNTDIEEPFPKKKNRKHYVNTEPNDGSTMAFQSTSITHTKDDSQMPNQDINLAENKENDSPDYHQTNISESEYDTLPPFQKTEMKELTKTDDSTLPFQNTNEEGLRSTGGFMQPSPTNNVPKSKDGYVLMDENVNDHPVSTQRTKVQPEDGYALPLDTDCLSQSENGYTLPFGRDSVSQTKDDYELPLKNNGDVDEDDYSTHNRLHSSSPYVHTSSPAYPLHATVKSKEPYPQTINSDQIVQEPENEYSRLHGNRLDDLDDSKQNIYGLDSTSCLSKSMNNNCQ